MKGVCDGMQREFIQYSYVSDVNLSIVDFLNAIKHQHKKLRKSLCINWL